MGNRREQRTRIAIPVKVHTRDEKGKPVLEAACTMDIAPRGARLTGVHCVKHVGEVLCIERGKSKAFYRVQWIGKREDGRESQVGLHCIEPGAAIWGVDVLPGEDERYSAVKSASAEERRKHARYNVEGSVQIFKDGNSTDAQYGELANVSTIGCYIRMGAPLPTGNKIRMRMKIPRYETEFNVRGLIKNSDKAIGMWVEFTEIANQDAPILEKLLKKLETVKP
jgi:hypothetical protein